MDSQSQFEWDESKDGSNQKNHGISFGTAQHAFADTRRLIAFDRKHSRFEKRYFCYGMVEGNVVTVRYTVRGKKIRIFGAGYWREGRSLYNEKNNLH